MLDSDVESADSVNLATAWTRFCAKQFDLIIYYLVLIVAVDFISDLTHLESFISEFEREFPKIFILILLPFALAIDGFFISGPGNSPGRWIAGIKVRDLNGEKLSVRESIKRSSILYVKGFIFGVPILNLLGFFNSYNDIDRVGCTEWDESSHSRTYNDGSNIYRVGLLIIITVVIILGSGPIKLLALAGRG